MSFKFESCRAPTRLQLDSRYLIPGYLIPLLSNPPCAQCSIKLLSAYKQLIHTTKKINHFSFKPSGMRVHSSSLLSGTWTLCYSVCFPCLQIPCFGATLHLQFLPARTRKWTARIRFVFQDLAPLLTKQRAEKRYSYLSMYIKSHLVF